MRRGSGRTRCSIVAANKEVNEASRGGRLQYCSRCINEVTLNTGFMIASENSHQPGVQVSLHNHLQRWICRTVLEYA